MVEVSFELLVNGKFKIYPLLAWIVPKKALSSEPNLIAEPLNLTKFELNVVPLCTAINEKVGEDGEKNLLFTGAAATCKVNQVMANNKVSKNLIFYSNVNL